MQFASELASVATLRYSGADMSIHTAPADELFGFGELTNSAELVDVLLKQREDLAALARTLGGIDLMRAYSDLTDALIRRVFDIAIDEAASGSEVAQKKASRAIAIAAVGGYGRREMSPYSDVDVAFLMGGEEDHDVNLVLRRAFRMLMDILDAAHLSLGYSYRRVDDVEHLEIETQTALLDARWVAGSASVFGTFQSALRDAIVSAAFVIGHVGARGGVTGSDISPFLVEPDVKEGCGGLRDLHAARWTAQVAFGLTPDNVWEGLRARGILGDGEIADVHAAAEFVSCARNALHLLARRGLDTLSRARHTQVAEAMGFPDAEEFALAYYKHAHVLWRIFYKVADASLQHDLEIEPGIVARDGRLHILDRGLLRRDNAALVRVFQHAQSYGLRIDRQAADIISAVTRSFVIQSEGKRCFLDMLSRPGAAAALRSMADTGVLQVLIPDFDRLVYLVPGDAAHKYTVGEHSLRAVEHLEALLREDNEQFTDVFSRIQHFEVLFLATLLHDVGKLDSLRDHARTGAGRAARFAAELGMSEDACARVEFLVANHLAMSEVARMRDLSQKKTINDFVAMVRDQQTLDMLFLLTVADNRAVGVKVWSQVQVRFLLELHERAMVALRSPGSGVDIERHRTRVRRELCLANLPAGEVDEHIASMPPSYLLNTSPEELAAHIGYVRTVRAGSPAVEIKDDRAGEFTELTVVTMDRPGLLNKIAGVLHAVNIDVHAAQIFTRESAEQIAIDRLYIDFEGRQLAEMNKWQLEADLRGVLMGEVTVDELLRRRGKKEFKRPLSFTVKVLENLSEHETVIEIRAEDTPGLLHYLTRKISDMGWNIHSARVATWGHEARDVFYVTTSSGDKLNVEQVAQLRGALEE